MQEYTPDANAFSQGADSLSRNQNRALEEALISQNGMKKKDGGILKMLLIVSGRNEISMME